MKGWDGLVDKLPFTTIFSPPSKLSHWPMQMSALDPTEIRGRRKSTKLHSGCITHFCISDIFSGGFSHVPVMYFLKEENIFLIHSFTNIHAIHTCQSTPPSTDVLVFLAVLGRPSLKKVTKLWTISVVNLAPHPTRPQPHP